MQINSVVFAYPSYILCGFTRGDDWKSFIFRFIILFVCQVGHLQLPFPFPTPATHHHPFHLRMPVLRIKLILLKLENILHFHEKVSKHVLGWCLAIGNDDERDALFPVCLIVMSMHVVIIFFAC